MKICGHGFLATLATLGGIWLLVQLPAAAQQGQSGKPSAPPKPAPHLPSGRVDFSGVWRPGDVFLIEDISLGLKKGRWEGNTLVIDTVGLQLHTIERYTRPDLATLVEEVTIDDPGAYTKPFTITASHRLLPDDDLMEYICQENNRDVNHLVGPAGRP